MLRFFDRLRKASSMSRAPKSDAAFDNPPGMPASPFGATDAIFRPLTVCFSRVASSVKFCAIWIVPPKLTIAISRFGPALESMNFAAACRACT